MLRHLVFCGLWTCSDCHACCRVAHGCPYSDCICHANSRSYADANCPPNTDANSAPYTDSETYIYSNANTYAH